MNSNLEQLSPYVGPRPFESQHREIFFGRKRETNEIVSLSSSHRVIVLFAQSGAGKTSLINAGVIPALEEKEIDVLPITKIHGLIPDEIKPDEVANPYVFNAILSWGINETELQQFKKKTIQDYLAAKWPRKKDKHGFELPSIIIFDQFEELFTAYPDRWQYRKSFIHQMVEALDKNPLLRIMLVIREDYVAQLDPFTAYFPEKLRNRYRLECLKEAQALSAIKEPLTKVNLTISKNAAETLVNDLRQVRVETYEGTVAGEYVEPVQLQIVCEKLWRGLPEGTKEITTDHLEEFGDVDQALSAFYENSIKEAVEKSSVKEGDLRIWFEQTLITPAGTRGTVHREYKETGGISNEAVDILVNLFMIRAEIRSGGRWYELTHDRFIKPILDSNEKWSPERQEAERKRKHLENLTKEWVRMGKTAGGLLDEVELREAKRWTKVLEDSKLSYDEEIKSLIIASEEKIEKDKKEKEAARKEKENARKRELGQAQALAEEQRKHAEAESQRAKEQEQAAKRSRSYLIAVIILFVIAAVTAVWGLRQKNIAEDKKKSAIEARNDLYRELLRTNKRNIDNNAYLIFLAERLIHFRPEKEDVLWHNLIASSLSELGDYEGAIREADKALEIDSENVQALNLKRFNLNVTNQRKESKSVCENIKRLLGQADFLVKLDEAVFPGLYGYYHDADSLLRKLIKEYSFNGREYSHTRIREDIQKATRKRTIFMDEDEMLTLLYYHIASVQANAGELSGFVAALKEADDKRPRSLDAYLYAINWAEGLSHPNDYGSFASRGALWKRAGYENWAAAYFDSFLVKHKFADDSIRSKYNDLKNWVEKERRSLSPQDSLSVHDDKEALYIEAVRFKTLANFYASRGQNDEAQSKLDLALNYINRARRLDNSNNLKYLIERATIEYSSNEYEQVIADCDSILEINPLSAIAYFYRAMANKSFYKLNDTIVVNDLKEAVKFDPANGGYLIWLGMALENDSADVALNCYQRAKSVEISILDLPYAYYYPAH